MREDSKGFVVLTTSQPFHLWVPSSIPLTPTFPPFEPMERIPPVPKRAAGEKPPMDDDEGEEEVASAAAPAGGEEGKKYKPAAAAATRRVPAAGGCGGPSQPCCQAERCTADLTEAKRYHRRHKVCEAHSKAPVVLVAGLRQRFCQQCSRFHELSEFDETKRSCRTRLAGHNERRRKSSSDPQGEDSSHCRPADQSRRLQISLAGNPTYKHFQIR